MLVGYMTNDPDKPVSFPIWLSGEGYRALCRLEFFYKEESGKVIDRLLREKAATLFGGKQWS